MDQESSASKSSGFRFAVTDAIVLGVAAAGAWLLHPVEPLLTWLIVFAVGHFFLFCNVIRMRRSYELVWAALFLVNFGAFGVALGAPFKALLVQFPFTLLLVLLEVRDPRYRGMFARRECA
jgi:hypothetical protein